MIARLLFTLLLFFCLDASSQKDETWHSVIYGEAGGPGSIASINIEHYSIEKNKFKIGARFGLGVSRFKDFMNNFNPDTHIPFGIFATDDLLTEREKKLNSYFQIGTSYVFREKIHFRISYTPILTKNLGLGHWGAISIGHTF